MKLREIFLISYSLTVGIGWLLILGYLAITAYFQDGIACMSFNDFGENFFEAFILFPVIFIISVTALIVFMRYARREIRSGNF